MSPDPRIKLTYAMPRDYFNHTQKKTIPNISYDFVIPGDISCHVYFTTTYIHPVNDFIKHENRIKSIQNMHIAILANCCIIQINIRSYR